MHRYFLRTGSRTLCLVLCGLLLAGGEARPADADGPAGGDSAAADSGPQFKSEKYRERWDQGLELLAAGEYRKAEKEFARAYTGAKTKADKALIKQYRLACRSGPRLAQMEQLMAKGQLNAAYELYGALYPSMAGTTLGTKLQTLAAQIDAKLFQVVENFEYRRREYSEKYGKYWITDPALVLRGKQCLRWQSVQGARISVLKLRAVPRDWRGFSAIEFYARSPRPISMEAVITTDRGVAARGGRGGARTAAPKGAEVVSAFMLPLRLNTPGDKWTRVKLELKNFKSQGDATMASVKDFRIQIQGGRQFLLHLDEFRMMRKDPESEETRGGTRRRR